MRLTPSRAQVGVDDALTGLQNALEHLALDHIVDALFRRCAQATFSAAVVYEAYLCYISAMRTARLAFRARLQPWWPDRLSIRPPDGVRAGAVRESAAVAGAGV